jgi:hypothetical protein
LSLKSFNERKNIPKPPKKRTRVVIRSKELIGLKRNWIEDITPKINAANAIAIGIFTICIGISPAIFLKERFKNVIANLKDLSMGLALPVFFKVVLTVP